MNPLAALLAMPALGGFVALAIAAAKPKKAAAASPISLPPPSPDPAENAETAVNSREAAIEAARAALAAQQEQERAAEATRQALERAAIAERQALESAKAAQQATDDRNRATEQAAAADAAREALEQRQTARDAAALAIAAKKKKQAQAAIAERERAKAKQAADAVDRQAVDGRELVRTGAVALATFLANHPHANAFGYAGHPSPEVEAFQRLALKHGFALKKIDGILGPDVRAVGELVGVIFPQRPKKNEPAPQSAQPQPPQQQREGIVPGKQDHFPGEPGPYVPDRSVPPPVVVETPPMTAPQPAPGQVAIPEGFNATEARTLASQVTKNLRRSSYSYDRALLKRFQRAAGLETDGHYGGGTRGALIFYGAKDVPKPLFKPLETVEYRPPVVAG